MFGRVLEQVWGPKRFLTYYLICGIGAGLIQEVVQYIEYATVLSNYDSVQTPFGIIPMSEYLNQMTTVGASGAVYGILLAFGMLFPNSEMFVFPLPVPIKAKYFVLGYAALELVLGITGGDGIAHFAHLGGMLFGLILILYWKRKMAAGGFITDLRQKFRQGDIVTRLIFLNVGAFLLVSLVSLFLTLFRWNAYAWLHWLELPAWVSAFVRQPWSLITYMFMHAGLLHLLFNMLWLYWFGRLFLNIFSSKHLRGLYVLGGICGGCCT